MQQIPVLDVDGFDAATLRSLDAACRDWGFFQIVGHGLAPELREALLEQLRNFFRLPAQRKRAVERSARNAWGYYDRELTKNERDWKEIFDVGPAESEGPLAGSAPQWPADLPGFRETLERFAAACERISRQLLSAIAHNLVGSADALDAAFAPTHTSFLRLNHYPVCGDPAPPEAATTPPRGQLGVHHHTDAGALTVLLQDEVPGLQVLRDGAWHTIEPRPDALVVNLGDLLQVWSNDAYRAPLHRVIVSADRERYSAPYFFNPAYASDCAPLTSPPRYRPINWGEFRAGRAAGDYADLGEEIQIDRYRIQRSAAPR